MFEIKTDPNESMQNYPPEAKSEPDRKAGRHAGVTGENMADVAVPRTPSAFRWCARHEPFAPAPKSYYFVSQNDEPVQSHPGELVTDSTTATYLCNLSICFPTLTL